MSMEAMRFSVNVLGRRLMAHNHVTMNAVLGFLTAQFEAAERSKIPKS
ncbi:hypothetical protein MAXJ12_31889 [Mesorhizobium alhagi CCNWXJ12-2]|uniref:Uncharacterized protein n=1 Tax=Mesorhizobium alhagi CCNWXJ12-2 TaxID=1107882 RepID=H0I1P0_9HYPH|nr:hypothetical protein MAXJ12_31889 [Mesorhizobium alhagi CCNWXJ12-2]